MTVEERLQKIEVMLAVLVERQQVREWYSVEEFAHIVERSEFTCREWCRHGRIGQARFTQSLVSLRWWIPVMSRSNHKRDCEVQEGACPSIVPAGAPDWITPELVEATIRVWQPYYKDVLTPEEAVTMILDVGRLFDALSSRSPP